MRKNIFLISMLIVSAFLNIQAQGSSNIPTIVKAGFEQKYPNQQAEWSQGKNDYIARFDEHGKRAIVHFNKQGNLTQRGWYIILSELPQAAVVYLNQYYPRQSFTDAFTDILKWEDSDGGVSYQVRWKGSALFFDANGVFIKQQKQKE
jgi:hypothetical protein